MGRNSERERAVKAALRRAITSYRKADTAGEKAERELKRLRERKTLIEPDELEKMQSLYQAYIDSVNASVNDIDNVVGLVIY